MSGSPGEAVPGTVALVGFMGAGKSTVGRALAALLGRALVDTDERVVEAEGPVAGIFARGGEPGFRRVERDVVLEAVEAALLEPCVLALGGGAVETADVRAALARLPHVVWLDGDADVLWARVARAGASSRPLATDRRAFGELLARRAPLYREVATLVIRSSGDEDPAQVAARVARCLRRGPAVRVASHDRVGGR